MSTITVGKENSTDIDLYYEDHGTGKPVVLIHSYLLSSTSWEKQTAALLTAGFRVITYDRRGFGKSSQPATGYEYDTLARDLNMLVTELDLRDFALVGYSMGGGEVARYLGTYGTGRVSHVVFISAVPPYLLKMDDNPEGVDGSVFSGLKQAITADRPSFISSILHEFYNLDVYGGSRVSDQTVQASFNIAVSASPIATLDCVDIWGTDFRADLAKINVPALVIHGDADRIVPFPASGLRMENSIRGSRLIVIEGGPHAILWTHPEVVNPALIGFLREGDPYVVKQKTPEAKRELALPKPVAAYLAADKANDSVMLAHCFTADARVHDEARYYQGVAAIQAWKQESQAKYQYSVEPLATSTAGQSVALHARLTGSFPGSPTELDYVFTLSGDKIAALEIK